MSNGIGNPRKARSGGSPAVRGAHSRPLGAENESAQASAYSSNDSTQPSEYEQHKLSHEDADVYSRISSSSYLDSDAIRSIRKKRKRRKILTGVCVSLLVLLLAGAGAAFAYISNISSNLSRGLEQSLFDILVPTDTAEDPFYVLLLGVDGSIERTVNNTFGGTERSDSMMLARIDPRQKKATLLSIPRDTKVQLGTHGTNKINAAHAYGGPTLAVKTVSELTGVPISHYAEINFDGFAAIVDAIGGVEVDVPIEIDDDLAGGYVPAGRQVLNGEQALILCRSRHSYDNYGDGDVFRSANQRMVLSAVAKKLLACDPITIANTIQSMSEAVLTDMKVDEIVGVALNMRGMDTATDIYTAQIPSVSEYTGGVWYENVDKDAMRNMIKRMDAGLSPSEDDMIDDSTGTVIATAGTGNHVTESYVDRSATLRIRNGNGTDGVCAQAQEKLEAMGYRHFDTGNANNFDYADTRVVYKDTKHAEAAQAIADALGVGHAVMDDGDYLFESTFLIIIGKDWK